MKRAILYSRTSGLDAEKISHAAQLEMCREYAAGRGYRIVDELSEDERGVSGADFDAPQLNRAISLARDGEFDVLICRDIKRFSRHLRRHLDMVQRLNEAGATVEYVLMRFDDSHAGAFAEQVVAAHAELDRKETVAQLRRGRHASMRRGSVMCFGHAPFGYRERVVDGRRVLVVEPGEAETVRQIFAWYVQGDGDQTHLSGAAIARKLSLLEVPTLSDKGIGPSAAWKIRGYGQWSYTTVLGMLRNETYAGTWRYHVRDGTIIEVDVPAIVSRQVFNAAQERRGYNRRFAQRNVRHDYLLRGRIVCGNCGYKMESFTADGGPRMRTPTKYHYYGCKAARKVDLARGRCEMRLVRADQLDAAVWQRVVDLFADRDGLVVAHDAYRELMAESSGPLRAELARVEADIVRLEARRERLLSVYLDGGFERDGYRDRRDELELRLATLRSERRGVVDRIEALPDETVLLTLVEFADSVYEAIAGEDAFEERRWYVDTLEVAVSVSLDRRVTLTMHGVPFPAFVL